MEKGISRDDLLAYKFENEAKRNVLLEEKNKIEAEIADINTEDRVVDKLLSQISLPGGE